MKNNFKHILYVIFVVSNSFIFSKTYAINQLDTTLYSSNEDKRLVYDLIDRLFLYEESLDTLSEVKVPTTQTSGIQIFGWHPSWLRNAYKSYDYSLLSTVSYFSCTMKFDDYQNLEYSNNHWESSSTENLISLAKDDECNAILTLRCHEKSVIKALLKNEAEQGYCIQYITELITQSQVADGVNVTFEDIPLGYRSEFTGFLSELSTALKSLDKSLVLTLPAVSDTRIYDLEVLNSFIDQFVIMGYNYYYSGSEKPGPVSPLESGKVWGDLNLKNTLKDYLKKGLNKKKLIMALPFYGAVWEVDTLETGEVTSSFYEHRRINKIISDLDGKTPLYDTIAYSAYYTFTNKDKDYVCYFDNAFTLKKKFSWIESEQLAGVGIWALGYDENTNDIWKMIEDNFEVVKNPNFSISTINDTLATSKISVAQLEKTSLAKLKSDTINILKQKEVVIVIGGILIACILIGILLSLMSSAIFEKILIQDINVYMKVLGVFLFFILISILVSNFVLIGDESTAEIMELNKKAPVIISSDIITILIKVGVLGLIIISLLSWKAFLKLNKDIP